MSCHGIRTSYYLLVGQSNENQPTHRARPTDAYSPCYLGHECTLFLEPLLGASSAISTPLGLSDVHMKTWKQREVKRTCVVVIATGSPSLSHRHSLVWRVRCIYVNTSLRDSMRCFV